MVLTPSAPVSIPRFAPLLNSALSFDGTGTFAQATLPAGSLPTANQGVGPFSLTLWLNVPAFPAPAGNGSNTGTAEGTTGTEPPAFSLNGSQVVVELLGAKSGTVASVLIDENLNLGFQQGGYQSGGASAASVPLNATGSSPGYLGQWIFVAATYARASTTNGAENPGSDVTVLVSDGSTPLAPQPASSGTYLTLQPDETALTLRLGCAAAPGQADLAAYNGLLARVRLWSTALSNAQAAAVMYQNPIGPQAYQSQSLIADWRTCEGYGPMAFDYAGLSLPYIPEHYQPPPGNHLYLGAAQPDGFEANAPTWVIANIATLVNQTSNAQLSLVTPA
jgi:hypothetical protein